MNKDEIKTIKLLKDLGEVLTPKKSSLEKVLQKIDNADVTKEEFPRYSYSMMNWKFVAPITAVIVLLGFFAFKGFSSKSIQPTPASQMSETNQIPQTVTAQNADTALSQTDSQINQDMAQLDTDLTAVDATNNKEEDPNSL